MFVHIWPVFILSLPFILGGRTINDGDSDFDLSIDSSSLESEFQYHSQCEEIFAGNDGVSLFEGTTTKRSFHLHEQSLDGSVDIPLCEGFSREQLAMGGT